jgi:probable HAF family extracellular repeat protein
MRHRPTILAVLFAVLGTTTPPALLAGDRYDVTPLPFLPFSDTGGEALNNNGVVAGGIVNSDGSVSLAQWHEGVLTKLGTPPGLPSREFDRLRVYGINNAGTIVGTIHTTAGEMPSRSFVFADGRFEVLPLVQSTDLGGAAIGVNSSGEIVGFDRLSDRAEIGWRWAKGVYSSLPVSGTDTAALGINSDGTIIGNRKLSLFQRLLTGRICCAGQRGYVLSRGTVQYLTGFVYAINDLGEAVGGSTSGADPSATVYRDGIATVIVSLPSSAVGINLSGEVTGSFRPANDNHRHLFVWSANSGALDATPQNYRSAEAAAINSRGEVLGFGETTSGKSRYFLLTPAINGVLTPKPMMR